MSSEETTNIHTERQRCGYECRSTFRYQHGGSLPGGPFPGTFAGPGDVRRCEHGRMWTFYCTRTNRFYCEMDLWTRLHPVLTPIQYRRAVRALSVPGSSGEAR